MEGVAAALSGQAWSACCPGVRWKVRQGVAAPLAQGCAGPAWSAGTRYILPQLAAHLSVTGCTAAVASGLAVVPTTLAPPPTAPSLLAAAPATHKILTQMLENSNITVKPGVLKNLRTSF